MKAAEPPTASRRVRRLRSPGSVAVPRRLAPGLPPVQRSRTPTDRPSPRRLADRSADLTAIREAGRADVDTDSGRGTPADTVRVVVRCRPMNATERARGDLSLFRFLPKESTTLQVVSLASGSNNPNSGSARELVRSFQFDLCASEELSQGQFFRACGVIPLLESVVEGYLATVFAYGQTGSGKTYSMSGLDELLAGTGPRDERMGVSSSALENSDGLIPRALKHLFALLEQAPVEVKTVFPASQRNQLQALQDDHEKLTQRALATEQQLRQLEAENRALRQSQNQYRQGSQQKPVVSGGKSSPSNEMKQLREQVQQLQQREQELMQALSRRSRGRRDAQESGESARHS
ncbi:hypothetical protein PR002_g12377 [Phytophthora rubi]|uniref:Kinesin motor domain-containing protein n=1 Tax=Phytophthora rubi TaxID=129364 RepID=A0A6A3LP38_9STRA|nr:hypothetical protein PR002_g12377 [Phytophthora rubi]